MATTPTATPSIRGLPPAVPARHYPAIDPLSCWLLLIGGFLVVNGVIFVTGAAHQVQSLLARQLQQPSAPWHALRFWDRGRSDSDGFAIELAIHVTQTLGATYISLGLLAICLSAVPQTMRRLAALALVAWSSVQLVASEPAFLTPVEATNRVTFHGLVIVLTSAAALLSLSTIPKDSGDGAVQDRTGWAG